MDRLVRAASVLVLTVVIVAGCSASGGGAAKDARVETAAGLSFAVPKDWVSSPPSSSMRAAQFALPAESEGAPAPELVLFHFGEGQGGDTKANIDRWINQMQQPDGKPSAEKAKRQSRKVGNFQVSLVSVNGDYGGSTMGMMGDPHANPHDSGAKSDYRLWAVVVEGEGGPWFFKATGPRVALEKVEPALDTMIGTLKRGPATEARTD